MREVASGLRIGHALEARNLSAVLDAGIEAIVDLALEERPISPTRDLVYCRIPILDGAGNTPVRILLAIDTICRLVRSETQTLVACSAGMSRSPAIVAAALSRLNETAFEDEISRLAGAGPCDVSPILLADIVAALETINRDEES
jgi:protein-tyrosine phosphatase